MFKKFYLSLLFLVPSISFSMERLKTTVNHVKHYGKQTYTSNYFLPAVIGLSGLAISYVIWDRHPQSPAAPLVAACSLGLSYNTYTTFKKQDEIKCKAKKLERI